MHEHVEARKEKYYSLAFRYKFNIAVTKEKLKYSPCFRRFIFSLIKNVIRLPIFLKDFLGNSNNLFSKTISNDPARSC